METKQPETRETVTIEDVTYFRDTLGEKGEQILLDVLAIQDEMARKQNSLNIVTMAKALLFEKLVDMRDEFEIVPAE